MPEVRNKDRMMGPLLALIAAVVLLVAIFYTQSDEENVQAGQEAVSAADENVIRSETTDPNQVLEISRVNMMPLEYPAAGAQVATLNLQGEITNTGQREAKQILVEAQFYGKDGQLVHTQTEALVPLQVDEGDPAGEGSFEQNPLKAGETRPFRIALGPIPAEWDRETPKLRMVQVVVP